MNRLLFEKTGDAVYISHLDLMRIFQRCFKRADLMIWHSQVFSPRAYVSIALPLSVGTESHCELLDFEIENGSVDMETLPQRLNETLPAGIRVLRAYESTKKTKLLTYLKAAVTLEYDSGVPERACEELGKLFCRKELLIHKKTKRGETDLDLRPLISSMELKQISPQEVCISAVVSAQNPGLNPQLLVQAIETFLPELKPDFSTVHRLEVYDAEGCVFR